MKKYIFLFPFFLFIVNGYSQNRRSDSLVKVLQNVNRLQDGFTKDTARINALAEVAWELRVSGNLMLSLKYSDSAMTILKKEMDRCKGKPEIVFLKKKRVKVQSNIALVNHNQGNYAEALKIYYSILPLCEQAHDSTDIIVMYNNIGNVFIAQRNKEEAMDSYTKALAIAEKSKYKNIASIYDNLGILYAQDGKYAEAKKYFKIGLEHNIQVGYKPQIASSYNNLGSLSLAENNLDEALHYFQLALEMKIEAGDKTYLPSTYLSIGDAYIAKKDYFNAEKNYKMGLAYSLETGGREWTVSLYSALADLFKAKGDYKNAYENQTLYVVYHDSIQNQENTKKSIQAKVQYEYDKKAAADSVSNAEAEKVKDAELTAKNFQLEKEQTQRYGLYGGVVLLLVFGAFMLNRVQVTRKQKRIIEDQKEIVEEKQKEIVDSINYAQRIQSAILPDPSEIGNVFTDAFIFFKPKDIVSGDFFWMATINEYNFIVAADCTGHGVPGGFMSMLGSSLLNEIIIEKKIIEPGEILDMLRVKIILALKQKGDSGENKDGMDMVLCRFNKKKKELVFAAANNPLWMIRSGEMQEWKADKQPVGIFTGEQKMFSQQSISLQDGDSIYLFTDGFADQFGGPKGKKFKYKQMQDLLLENSTLSMKEQEVCLENDFQTWKGNLDQVDDVCVIGIKI
ncbi:MAG: tetratricopeptide repeat protein [Bacteroidetes bacterium]|nr:tetratricopeptide repeat protein [Bacteroidota bacterium]